MQGRLMSQLFTVRCEGPPLANSVFVGIGSSDGFEHAFGGPPRHAGVTHPGCPKPWHLSFTLDLTDPKLELKIPGVRWLALYNAFQYDSSAIQYRIVSDSEVQIVYQERLYYTPDFPYERFPEQLPLLRATVGDPQEVTFDDEKEWSWRELYCVEGDDSPPDRNQLCALEAGIHQMQFVGLTPCRHCGTRMNLLAAFTGDFVEYDFSIWEGNPYVVIVYQLCPECQTIQAENLTN
jgi:hypothetical protein